MATNGHIVALLVSTNQAWRPAGKVAYPAAHALSSSFGWALLHARYPPPHLNNRVAWGERRDVACDDPPRSKQCLHLRETEKDSRRLLRSRRRAWRKRPRQMGPAQTMTNLSSTLVQSSSWQATQENEHWQRRTGRQRANRVPMPIVKFRAAHSRCTSWLGRLRAM